MKKNKGFTLVELLAVIVILAVIALIATPQILKLINDSRKGAAEESMHGYIKAVENAYVKSQMESNPTNYKGLTFTSLGKDSIAVNGEEDAVTLSGIDLTGSVPTGTTNKLHIDDEGTIECANIQFGDFYVSYIGSDGSATADPDEFQSTCPTA